MQATWNAVEIASEEACRAWRRSAGLPCNEVQRVSFDRVFPRGVSREFDAAVVRLMGE